MYCVSLKAYALYAVGEEKNKELVCASMKVLYYKVLMPLEHGHTLFAACALYIEIF